MHNAILAAGVGLLSLASSAPTATTSEATTTIQDRNALLVRTVEIGGVTISRKISHGTLDTRDSNAVVTGSAATSSINNNDGIGAGSTSYTSYSGDGTPNDGWPDQSQWVSFVDMFNNNKPAMSSSCGNDYGLADDSGPEIGAIYDGIQAIAQQAQLDHRFILATMMQESSGCVRAPTSANGYANPGLMQSFQGYYTCNDNTNIENDNYEVRNPCPSSYITNMIREGAVGTDTGDGLASNMNEAQQAGTSGAQTYYYAARLYNSGSVCDNNLSNACGATQSYSSDIANRLTGWVG